MSTGCSFPGPSSGELPLPAGRQPNPELSAGFLERDGESSRCRWVLPKGKKEPRCISGTPKGFTLACKCVSGGPKGLLLPASNTVPKGTSARQWYREDRQRPEEGKWEIGRERWPTLPPKPAIAPLQADVPSTLPLEVLDHRAPKG